MKRKEEIYKKINDDDDGEPIGPDSFKDVHKSPKLKIEEAVTSYFTKEKDETLKKHPLTWKELKSSQNYYSYSKENYPFDKALRILWHFEDLSKKLEDIHLYKKEIETWLENQKIEYCKTGDVKVSTDQHSCFHRMFYRDESKEFEEFKSLYLKFVQDIILPLFHKSEGNEFVVQTFPTFRTQVPNMTALGENRHFIKEQPESLPLEAIGYHCDSQYLHPPSEINFILAITKMFDTNTIMVETHPDSEKFVPVTQDLSQVFSFYGNKCHHFNLPNKTGKTRISFDFRVIPMSRFDFEDYNKSLTQGKAFKIGDYYQKMNRKQE